VNSVTYMIEASFGVSSASRVKAEWPSYLPSPSGA